MSLFSIDVDAEIRKLCGRQFASPADRVSEWVRLLLGTGARSVRLSLSRSRAVLEVSGLPAQPPPWWGQLARLGRHDLDSLARHEALVALEADGGPGALGLAPAPRLVVEGWGERRVGLAGTWRVLSSDLEAGRCRLTLPEGLGPKGPQLLYRNLRWSTVPIWLDGAQIAGGRLLPHTILTTSLLGDGISGTIGLPRRGELCRSVYLAREVVAQDMTGVSPSGEAHFAVIQDDRADRPDRVRAHELNAAVRSLRGELYARLPRELVTLSAEEQPAARRLLIKRAEHTGEVDALTAVPLFPRLEGPLVAPGELRQLAPQGNLWAVDPGEAPRGWSVSPHRVLVLGEVERRFVVERLGWRVSEPPRAVQRSWLQRTTTRLRSELHSGWQSARRRWMTLGQPRPVSRAELSAAELALLQAIHRELEQGRYLIPGYSWEVCRNLGVEMVERGALPLTVSDTEAGRYLAIPRTHPAVRRAVLAHQHNPGLLYPILAMLFGGSDGFGSRKEHWQRAWLRSVRA